MLFDRPLAIKRGFSSFSVNSELDLGDEAEHHDFLVRRLAQLMRAEFEPKTWEACWRIITEERSAADIGRELGISANAVRVAKCRVLRRLRQELEGLW